LSFGVMMALAIAMLKALLAAKAKVAGTAA
jgi:hypothetical protein